MDRLVSLKADAFLATCRSGTITPYEGTIALLTAFARRGPVAVCSGSQRESVMPVLESLNLVEHLSAIVTRQRRHGATSPTPTLTFWPPSGWACHHPIAPPSRTHPPASAPPARPATQCTPSATASPAGSLHEAHHIHDCCKWLTINHLLG
jgi:hypothetical protein